MLKYYKVMLQKKRWKFVIRMAFGLAMFIFTVIMMIDGGFTYNSYEVMKVKIDMLLLPLVGISFVLLYYSLIACPMWENLESQDMTEYRVSSDDEYIYIKYKNYEWKKERNKFNRTSLFWRDSNKKWVSYTTGSLVYFTVEKLFSKEIVKEEAQGKIGEVNDLFQHDYRIASIEEKMDYINYFNLRPECMGLILLIVVLHCVCFLVFLNMYVVGMIKVKHIVATIIIILLQAFIVKCMNNKHLEYRWLKENDLYITEVEMYDDSYPKNNSSDKYYIKIKKDDLYLNDWYGINKAKKDTLGKVNLKCYFFNDKNNVCDIKLKVNQEGSCKSI